MAKKIRIATSPLTNTIFAGDIKDLASGKLANRM